MNVKLANKNKEVRPEEFEKLYGLKVSKRFRKKYSHDKVEAIINNYIADPTNEEYIAEMNAMQEFRQACKTKARTKLGIK